MNTEEPQLQTYLKGLTTAKFVLHIRKIEEVLKNEGFTVPPRPASKTIQGGPGKGQEVKLTDREVITNLVGLGQVYITFNTRAIMACTRESVRNIFTNLLNDHITAYKFFTDLGKKRNIFEPPPPATAKKDSLNMGEVGIIWDELRARYLSYVNMETYLASTKDNDLINLINWGLNEIVTPQMKQLESVLRNEGFTILPRPPVRQYQYTPGQVNKIKTSDDELLGIQALAFQAAVGLHSQALSMAFRDDIIDLFEKFLYDELKGYEKLMALAKSMHALSSPPVVSSLRI